MSIVLPRKKKNDIFAPRKSIQDAKDKLGPAFFDPSLIGCARNAIELSKLVEKWEKLDREKVKILRDISREQNFLIRSYQKSHNIKSASKYNAASVERTGETENVDGKKIFLGFRYTSKGDLKSSKTSLPVKSTFFNDEEMVANESESGSNDEPIDYSREILALQTVLVDVCRELSRSRLSLTHSHTSQLRTFLRAHSRDFISVSSLSMEHFENPNDRFAFQPGSAERRNLHKQTVHLPSSRACSGCQYKLKQEHDDFHLKLHDSSLLQRRWSYVPSGKYVQSSTVLRPAVSAPLRHCSSTDVKQSQENFHKHKTDSEIVPRKTVSFKEPQNRKTYLGDQKRPKSCPKLAQSYQAKGKKWGSTPTFKSHKPSVSKRPFSKTSSSARNLSSAESSVSSNDRPSSVLFRSQTHSAGSINIGNKPSSAAKPQSSVISSGLWSSTSSRFDVRVNSLLTAEYDRRMDLLKEFQAKEVKKCNSKVSQFLQELKSIHNRK